MESNDSGIGKSASPEAIISPEKIFHPLHEEALANFVAGKVEDIVPINAEVHPTMACNRDCDFCNTKKVFGPDSLRREDNELMQSLEDARWLADELASVGIQSVNISGGGEPLMNQTTPDFTLMLKERDIQAGLVTDGDLIRPNNVDKLVNGCTWMRVSIDGASDESFDKIHATSNGFSRVMKRMEDLIAAKERNESACVLGLNFVITPDNFSEVAEFAHLTKDMGFNFVGYKAALPGFEEAELDREVVREAKSQIESVMSLKDDSFDVFPFHMERFDICDRNHKVEYDECPMAYFFVVVRPNGDVVPCTHIDFQKEGYDVPSLRQMPLADILKSSKRFQLIQAMGKEAKCFKSCQFERRNNHLDFARKGGQVIYKKRDLIHEIPRFL